MLVRINFGCGQTPSQGWINLDNSYALKLKKFYPLVSLLKIFNLISSSQLRNVEFNRKKIYFLLMQLKNLTSVIIP